MTPLSARLGDLVTTLSIKRSPPPFDFVE